MATGRAARGTTSRAAATTVTTPGLLGTTIKNPDWLKAVRATGRLEPGQLPKGQLTVPVEQAQQLLRGIVRFVVDIPADTSTVVVWERDGAELWVDVATTTLTCAEGLVSISVDVGCDQTKRPVTIVVPIGVGSSTAPAGLVMTTIDRLAGPDLVTARWSEAITAFAWEALVELARRLCAQVGKDKAGLALIPGAIAASRGSLLIQPMSRNDLSALGR